MVLIAARSIKGAAHQPHWQHSAHEDGCSLSVELGSVLGSPVEQYSIRYEKDAFDTGGGGGSADYLWMLVFGTTVLSILSLAFFQLPFLSFPLMFMVIYVWSRK
eukprot:1434-Heterococcus_DN1.PRE.1